MKILKRFSNFSVSLNQEYYFKNALAIRKRSIYVITGALLVLFLTELIVDFDNTTIELCLAFLIPNILLCLLLSRTTYKYWIGHIQVFFIFLIIQIHFFYNPEYFNVLVYWMPFIPLISVFLISIRVSFIWLAVTLLTIFIDISYGESVVGESYTTFPRFRAFGAAGIVFVSGLFVAYLFLYRLLAGYYVTARRNQDEINRLNSELKELNENLEKKVEDKVADIKSQNERLEKYSFMNAHIVRAPLANIMGAMELYKKSEDTTEKEGLLGMVEESAHKLDEAVREVAQDLHYEHD